METPFSTYATGILTMLVNRCSMNSTDHPRTNKYDTKLLRILLYAISVAIVLANSGCTTDSTEDPDLAIEITSEFYFDGKINGKRVLMQEGINDVEIEAIGGCSEIYNCGCCNISQYAGLGTGNKYVDSPDEVTFHFIHLWFYQTFNHQPDGYDINSMFRVGTYPFSDSEGVVLRYLDTSGQLWGSDVGDNTNAYIEILSVEDETVELDYGLSLNKIIEVSINVDLYPIVTNIFKPKPKDKKKELREGFLKVRASTY